MRLNSKVILSLASVMMMSECAWAMDDETTAGAGVAPVRAQAHYAMPDGVSPIARTVSHVSSDSATASKASTQKARAVTSLPPLDISETRAEFNRVMEVFKSNGNIAYALPYLETLREKVENHLSKFDPAAKELLKLHREIEKGRSEVHLQAELNNQFNLGYEEGFDKGFQSAKETVALRMLQLKMPWNHIVAATGLSYKKLREYSSIAAPDKKDPLSAIKEDDKGDKSDGSDSSVTTPIPGEDNAHP